MVADPRERDSPTTNRFAAPTYTRHRLSLASGDMDQRTFAALVDSIAESDQPTVTLYEGQILDSWYVWLACEAVGVNPVFAHFDGDDPVKFVLERNLVRRHLSAGQRAAAVVSLYDWRGNGRPKKGAESAPFSAEEKSVAHMASVAAVSPRTVQKAKALHSAGRSEEVLSGKMPLEAAYASLTNIGPDTERSGWRKGRAPDLRVQRERDELARRIEELEKRVAQERQKWVLEIETRNAKISKLEGARRGHLATIARLKAENFQLKEQSHRYIGITPSGKRIPEVAVPPDQIPLFPI